LHDPLDTKAALHCDSLGYSAGVKMWGPKTQIIYHTSKP
jgi:hypothetical protein